MAKSRHIVVGVHDFAKRGWAGVMEVERTCFSHELAWDRENYEAAMREGVYCITADDGFVRGACWVHGDEIHSLGVSVEARGRNVGKRLMRYAMARIRRAGYKKAFLHVEPSAIAAQRLYISLKFKPVEFVSDYHGLGVNAIKMVRKL